MEKQKFNGSCVYKIKNKVNGHFYIGSSVDYGQRINRHIRELRSGKNKCRILQRAYNKYGEIAFEVVVVEVICDAKRMLNREQFYLDTLNPKYNICKLAGSWAGNKHSKESRRKMSLASKGRPKSKEHRKKLSEVNKGKTLSESTVQKMVATRKVNATSRGYYHSDKTKERISNAHKGTAPSKKCLDAAHRSTRKKVGRYSKSGVFLDEWESGHKASKVFKLAPQNINACCHGKLKSCGGFIWKFH